MPQGVRGPQVESLSKKARTKEREAKAEVVQPSGGPGAQGMWPLTEAVQPSGGSRAQGMRPLAEVERLHMFQLGQQQQQQQQLLAHQQDREPVAKGIALIGKEAQAKANDQMTRAHANYHHQQQK
eukprot:gene31474-6663_t